MTRTTIPASRSTGVVVGPVRATWLSVESHWLWYRRNWRSSAFSTFLGPVLFLLAMGFGFGSQVRPGAATGGLSYVEHLVPALLVTTAIQNANFDSTYAVFSAFKWSKTYWGAVATPLTPGQVFAGQLTWNALRLGASLAVFLAVAGLLGALTGPAVLWAWVFALLAGTAFSAVVVAWTATRRTDSAFNGLFRFVVMPMTLFTGAFFPMSDLPSWTWPLAWITPAWHGIELSRGAAFGTLGPVALLGHVAYLSALVVVGAVLGRRYFTRRLAV
ncbi:ABC transporter permease [Umezawaea beigongshangensis]|uniref:ABC transporter permease n=1 Tax=Umezawaea beigongshangensis TaxID=2780383 RepID=UPI0018F22255|nr:ABC transporter permease [Umezawaea beigongshangensis]